MWSMLMLEVFFWAFCVIALVYYLLGVRCRAKLKAKNIDVVWLADWKLIQRIKVDPSASSDEDGQDLYKATCPVCYAVGRAIPYLFLGLFACFSVLLTIRYLS